MWISIEILQKKKKGITRIRKIIGKKKMNSKKNFSFPPKKSILTTSFSISKNNSIKNVKYQDVNSRRAKNPNALKMKRQNINLNKSSINNINNNVNNKKETFINFEINSFSYQEALKKDNRRCLEYYCSLIKSKQPIIFTFCPIKDYNSMIIKIDITCLSFSIYYFSNFLFINEEMIHNIYLNEGKYDLILYLNQILISFGVSYILTIIIKLIFLSEKNILKIKKEPTYNKAYYFSEKVKRNLIIKYIIFFMIGLIFLTFFWMGLSSFGAVYQNTQVILFENTLISFAISLIFPFFINIFPCIFRMIGISSKSPCIYNFSRFLQFL